ncbi:MAG: hypothetical protein QM715_13000 [Nibricoccus sp.]
MKLFALNSSEQNEIEAQLTAMRKKLEALEPSKTSITKNDQGTAIITVEPSISQGSAIYDEAMAQMKRVMGDERYAAFTTLSGDRTLESNLGYFGNAIRTIAVTPVIDANGRKTYEIKDERNSPGEGSTIVVTTAQSREEIEQVIGPLAKKIPTNF